jgi:dTDP-4-amino-4,6-dideoxygalactose transaminase
MHTIEGGMITTPDAQLARTLRLLRNQGMDRPYHHEIIGFNARLTDVAAAIGRIQLAALPRRTAARRANAAYLNAHLCAVAIPPAASGVGHVYHQYTVRAPDREALRGRLAEAGIGTGIYYPVPVHRQPAHQVLADLPATDDACAQVLSLPVHPDLSSADLARIAAAVNP